MVPQRKKKNRKFVIVEKYSQKVVHNNIKMFRYIFHELKVQKSEDHKAGMYGPKNETWRFRDWMNVNLQSLDK